MPAIPLEVKEKHSAEHEPSVLFKLSGEGREIAVKLMPDGTLFIYGTDRIKIQPMSENSISVSLETFLRSAVVDEGAAT